MYPTFSFIAKMGNARSASYSYQDLTSFNNESCSVNTYTLTEESYHSAYRPPCGSSSWVSAPGPVVAEGPVNYPMQQMMEAKVKLQHRAASCASLIRSTQDLSAIDTSIVSSPFRRHAPQFLSLRSYSQGRKRPLDHRLIYGTVRSTTSSPSLSARNELAMKTRAYVSDARRRRQTVEQTLWAAEKDPRVSLGSELLSDLSYSETTNQGPWNASEDEANDTNQRDAYSIHSQSDASFVTMATTMTSLPPSATNYNTSATMMLPLMNYSMRSDQGYGSTSGIFYLDCLKQLLGKIPSYVHLQQGRLHLKLRRGVLWM